MCCMVASGRGPQWRLSRWNQRLARWPTRPHRLSESPPANALIKLGSDLNETPWALTHNLSAGANVGEPRADLAGLGQLEPEVSNAEVGGGMTWIFVRFPALSAYVRATVRTTPVPGSRVPSVHTAPAGAPPQTHLRPPQDQGETPLARALRSRETGRMSADRVLDLPQASGSARRPMACGPFGSRSPDPSPLRPTTRMLAVHPAQQRPRSGDADAPLLRRWRWAQAARGRPRDHRPSPRIGYVRGSSETPDDR